MVADKPKDPIVIDDSEINPPYDDKGNLIKPWPPKRKGPIPGTPVKPKP